MRPEKYKDRLNQKGQALIIILLTMSVVLTVVLSSVSRSTTEVVVTSYEEDALRAFSAAEAGVEERLLDPVVSNYAPVPLDSSDPTSPQFDADVYKRNITGDSEKMIKYPRSLSSGESATFYVTSRTNSGQFICDPNNPCWVGNEIRVCYGKAGSTPAMEVSIYYDTTHKSHDAVNNYADVEIFRIVYDNVTGRTPGSVNALLAGCDFNNDGVAEYKYRAIINTDSYSVFNNCSKDAGNRGCMLFLRTKVFYEDDQPLGFWPVSGNAANIPSQGVLISSEGVAGESTRKVEVYQGHPQPLTLFDSAIFSLSGLSK